MVSYQPRGKATVSLRPKARTPASSRSQNNGFAKDHGNGAVIIPFPKRLPEGFTPEMAAEMERVIRRDHHPGKRGTCDSAYHPDGGPGADLPQTAGAFLREFHGEGPWMVFSALPKDEAGRRKKEAKEAVKAAKDQGETAIAAAAAILKQANIDCAMWADNVSDKTKSRKEVQILKWIAAKEKLGRNLYFSVANLRPMAKPKKAKKVDVLSLKYLWTDIDPNNDINPHDAAALDLVREAILNLLENLPDGVPPPTWIFDSGRGIWAIWELAERLAKPADSPHVAADETDPKKIREAEAWLMPHEARGAGIINALNEALTAAGIKARADSCYNAERVARLPGTRNLKTGRMAAVIQHYPDRLYALADFSAIDISNKPGRKGGNGAPIEFPAELPRNVDIDALDLETIHGYDTAAAVRRVIRDGISEGDGFDGHSGPAMWFVVCKLAEAKIDPAIMASIILDDRFKISSQILNHDKPIEYAYRQVRRAIDFTSQVDDREVNEDGDFWNDFYPRVDNANEDTSKPDADEKPDPKPKDKNEWREPKPLPDGLLPVVSFECGFLPASIGPWVDDISDRLQCPPDYVGVAAMVALGSVIGRRVGIRPQQRTDWIEVPNLWGAIVGSPGSLKSPALEEVLKPVKRLDIEASRQYAEAMKKHEQQLEKYEMFKKDMKKKAGKGELSENDKTWMESEQPESPKARRYIVNDSTYEALRIVLADNPIGTMVYRDEIIPLIKHLDREDQIQARGFYLSAWNGKSGYTFDRVIRGKTHIEALCLSLLGATKREIPSASHGFCAGRLGMIPCARRHRSERKRAAALR